MITIKDVAKHAGVSFKTVSRVVNGVSTVDKTLQERVRKSIGELGYQPNLAARDLRGAATSLAFVYDNPNAHYIVEVQEGIIDACRSRSFEVVVHPCNSTVESIEDELLFLAQRTGIGGLILTPPFSESEGLVQTLLSNNVNLVRVLSGQIPSDVRSPLVLVDDRGVAQTLTEYLIGLGHQNIAFLSGESTHSSTIERLEGFKTSLERHDIEINPERILPGCYTFDSGAERTAELLPTDPSVSAIVACNDEIAAGALYAALRLGIEVPKQLSIVGFEDSPFSRQSWPNLTTAHQSNKKIGCEAARLLIDQITWVRSDQPQKPPTEERCAIIHPKLVIRDSSGPANPTVS